jgi:hypothetical protein
VAEKELVSQLPAIAAGVEVGFGRRWIAGAGGAEEGDMGIWPATQTRSNEPPRN